MRAVGENGRRFFGTGETLLQRVGGVADAGWMAGGVSGRFADVRALCSWHDCFCLFRHSLRKLMKHHRPFKDNCGTIKLKAACRASNKEPIQLIVLYCTGVMRARHANPVSTMTAPE